MQRQIMWRGVVTAGAVLAALGLTRITLPGLDLEYMAGGMEARVNVANFSIGALGIMPLLTAGFLVELTMLWRPTRNATVAPRPFGFLRGDRGGAPADFAGRARIVYALTLVLALLQAMGVSYFLRRMQLPGYPDSDWPLTATLVGGVFCHAALARVIDEQGLGSGVLVVFLCNALGGAAERLEAPEPIVPGLAAFIVAAAATFFILRPGKEAANARVPVLTAGLLPLVFGSYLASLLASPLGSIPLAALAERLLDGVGATLDAPGSLELHTVLIQSALTAAAILTAAIVGSWVIVRPGALAALWSKATAQGDEASWAKQVRPALWFGIALSAGLSLALSLLDRGASYLHSQLMLASAGAMAAAIALDMRRVARIAEASSVVWADTRIAWLLPIRQALSRAGIASTALGEASSTLLPLNGPLVATRVLVASNDAEKASRVIAELLAEESAIIAAPARRAPASEPLAIPKRAAVAAFLALIAGVLMVAWPTAKAIQEQLAPPPAGEPATLAFIFVDDDSDPLERWGTGNFTPPEGIDVLLENVPLGDSMIVAPRAFAMARARGAETHAQVRDRLLEFLATIDIPPARRWAFQALPQDDGEKPGWRAFLLKTDGASLTHADLRAVEAYPDAQDPGRWQLTLEFTARGARAFEELTAANVKRRFAILVNDEIESAPVINQRISGGSAVITMGAAATDSKAEALALRDALRRSIGRR